MINVSANNQMELIPSGNHLAICYAVIDLGTQKEVYGDDVKYQRKVKLCFELCDLKKEFKQGEGEKPMVISKDFTMTLSRKSNLHLALQSWRGKPFTEDELKKFDLAKIIGYSAQIQIVHKMSSSGNEYSDISAIASKHASIKVPPLVNPKMEFSMDDFSEEKFNSLPNFIREKIMKSIEYQDRVEAQKNGAAKNTNLDNAVETNIEDIF